ncbi:hypothetical protein [Mycobacterium phage MS810]|uniref:Uncharacterized protein n=3 Tax=Faithunavirus TaxID=2948705 RepID=F6M855_9CAUD|nr:hypothetical protein SEA_FAITH1_60 [Mycobacterium phage Faith1]YP_008410935.1 hypothetical protein N848_gp060 [Mycobacterium phage Crossroads]YP_009017284.1 hypothetical protein CL57_gp059 [Mycobacterium phage Rumpelstiltskin]YP_009292574.1 hypothetical protein BI025_gp122 [Mycobacterium phage Gardann]YP_010013157.1 hypothetical protein J4T98_gp059 [Mycobacterium phage Tourach]AGK87623.1 hypothetical protein PBI_WINKY_60 [Mycobacterium phage Winky]AGM12669.1 hypothetical protein PBI_BREEZO
MAKVGTVYRKDYEPDCGCSAGPCFDMYVKTLDGWLLVDQYGPQGIVANKPWKRAAGFVRFPPKVSED